MAISQDQFFDEEFYNQFPELAETVSSLANTIYPGQPLTPAQQEELYGLQAQQMQLAPVAMPQPMGSTAIPGNPYSYDRSPIFNAIQQGLVQLANAQRQKKLLGDPEKAANLRKLKGERKSNVIKNMIEEKAREAEGILPRMQRLQYQQGQNEASIEGRRELLGTLFPSLVERLAQVEGNLAETAADTRGRIDIENVRGDWDRQIQEMRDQTAIDVANIRSQSGGGSGSGVSPSVVTNFTNNARQSANVLFDQAQSINDLLNSPTASVVINQQAKQAGMEPEAYRKQLQEEVNKKEQAAWNLLNLGARAVREGGLNEEYANEFEQIMNSIPGISEPGNDGGNNRRRLNPDNIPLNYNRPNEVGALNDL